MLFKEISGSIFTMFETFPVHPLKSQAKVLLSSVFGPYAQDDEYGSRKINPMELYHNQVTRVQGPFSLRMFHRSFGLMLIQANIDAPCTLLDFPTLDRFTEELRNNSYDIVGISSITPNVGKAEKMCKVVRKYLPKATIVLGGHIANMPNIQNIVDVDHIVKGDGIDWFQKFLKQESNGQIKHPSIFSGFGNRVLGLDLSRTKTAAILVPSVGCPIGCNFCSTSALFGGKGKFINFYETGDSLFEVMSRIEKDLGSRSFFVLDENFLLHRKRTLRLLELMEKHNKSWSLYVFSSAKTLTLYTMDQLIRLGVSWLWLGLEGENSQYEKLKEIDSHTLVQELRSNGIRVLGSTIIGLENHTPENINQVIDWAVKHNTDFHQFMLYTPLPGTSFYEQLSNEKTLLSEEECPSADIHGQSRFNYRHKHISPGQESEFLLRAFNRDFAINGPSIVRMIRTMLMGWERHKNHPDLRVRRRFQHELEKYSWYYSAAIWAMYKWYKTDKLMSKKIYSLLQDLYRSFGWKSKMLAPLLGNVIYFTMKKESKKLARGWTYEPSTFYEKNSKAKELDT